MNDRQKRFCDEYLIDCNAAQAAKRSGYAPSSGHKLLKKAQVQEYIEAQMKIIHNEKIADVQEISAYLTSVMRGTCEKQTITEVGEGGETTTFITVPAKERLKAAELLGKRHGMFSEKKEVSFNLPVFISGEENILD